jgi:diguanylate cyclase (GGDEF)-like protein
VAVGLFIRLFGDGLPVFLSTVLANILLLVGHALFYIALSQFTGFAYSWTYVGGITGAALAFLFYFTYVQEDIRIRMIVLSIGSLAMVSLLVHQLWKTQQTSLRFSASLMLASFVVHGSFLMIRILNLLLVTPQDSFSITPTQSATYLLSFAVSFFWSTGFILMVSQRLHNDLMEIATVDVLTRIPNRRATQAFLEKELSRAQREQSGFTTLLVDIDDFKQVNDRWGHAAGDEVLVRTAAIFQSMIRKQDWVGRWGGEEFLLVLPGTCAAKVLAERLRSEIAATEFTHGGASFGITVSIGVACGRPAEPLDQVLRDADRAMYQAKRTKNAVSVADQDAVAGA